MLNFNISICKQLSGNITILNFQKNFLLETITIDFQPVELIFDSIQLRHQRRRSCFCGRSWGGGENLLPFLKRFRMQLLDFHISFLPLSSADFPRAAVAFPIPKECFSLNDFSSSRHLILFTPLLTWIKLYVIKFLVIYFLRQVRIYNILVLLIPFENNIIGR